MKTTTLLLLIGILSTYAGNSYSQNARVTINRKNIQLEKMLTEIEKQTDYLFIYNNQVETKQIVSVAANNKPVASLLNDVLKDTNIRYSMEGTHIILANKNDKSVQGATVVQQGRLVSGVVLDNEGEPLIGVSVAVKGSTVGTMTDVNGKYSLTASPQNVLVFSYVSYLTQEKTVGNNNSIDIVLLVDNKILDEVVVTALGIKRAEKTLSYNVQKISADELTTVKSANFMNSLVGKVAGVNINSSAAGPGSAVKVVMRGMKSIDSNNGALYVIDGIPMYNLRRNMDAKGAEEGSMSIQPGSEPAADINPDDIESMTMLTGPSASALYGYEGANGVVLITTKKGRADRTRVTVSNTTTFTDPMMMPKFQNTYGNIAGEDGSWGTKTDKRYDPKKFFNTGSNLTNSVSLATGSEKSQSYLSVAATNAEGILPNNEYDRYNFAFRNTTSFLNDKLVLDASLNYIIQNHKNMISQGLYFNPLPALYLFPRGEDFDEVRLYERYDELMGVNNQYWPYSDQGLSLQNPYWIMNKMDSEMNKKRYKLSTSLQYKMNDWLNFQGRVNVDNSVYHESRKYHAGTAATFAGAKGRYMQGEMDERQIYADIMANINRSFGEDYTFGANIGGSVKDLRWEKSSLTGDLKHVTNYFTLENMDRKGYMKVDSDEFAQQTQSVFANVELGYKRFMYLTVTARNDWDSALAGSTSDLSFMYPSVGLSTIISDVVTLPKWFSFLKTRLSYTSVGASIQAYSTRNPSEYDEQLEQYKPLKWRANDDLKPEITNSYEAGVNMRFFDAALNLDATFYHSDTRNQTFLAKLPGASGYEGVYAQAGSVQNTGIELALGYQNDWNNFSWASNVTFTYNKNKVKELANSIPNKVTGELIDMPFIDKATLGSTGSPIVRLTPGGTMGDIYTNRDFQRDDNGYIYLNPATFLPSMVNTEYKKIGSLLPKMNAGWKNSFSYKGVKLNVLLAGRFGGVVVSNTQAVLDRYGVSETSAKMREGNGIMMNGKEIAVRDYLNIVASGTGQGAHYVYSATNIRLQEVSLEYTVPRRWINNIADITVGLVGNNLGMIYCKAPFDPELVASASNSYYTGVDNFMQPSLRNMGFSLKFQF